METLSRRELYELGAVNGVSLKDAIVATLKRFGIKSMVRGSAAEIHFTRAVEAAQGVWVKVDDMDFSRRYDFDVLSLRAWRRTRFEVKMGAKLKSGFSASISFRDSREVTLPSGAVWKTHARSKSEDFDYLAINLVNVTGRWSDFAYVHKSQFQDYSPKGFCEEDCKWIAENYWANTVRIGQQTPVIIRLREII